MAQSLSPLIHATGLKSGDKSESHWWYGFLHRFIGHLSRVRDPKMAQSLFALLLRDTVTGT